VQCACFADICNGVRDCIDGTDEKNCLICPEIQPNLCYCNSTDSHESCGQNRVRCFSEKRKSKIEDAIPKTSAWII